jgi:F-type H+-transporting ATPase subunit delta
MASTTASHNKPVAARYARALLELANKDGQAEPVREELKGLAEVLNTSAPFAAAIADPGVSEATRHDLLTKAFAGRVSPLMLNFLGLVNSKGRLGLLREIIEAYDDLLEEQLGNVEVDVTVAQRLSGDQLETVRQRVSTAIGRNAVVHQYVDESIIGGLVLRVQDKLIDASVKHQLETIRRQMLQAAAKVR